MDNIKIIYNGRDVITPQPTPFVGLTEESIYFGERWAQKETLTLDGQITGCTFGDIVTGYNNLLNNFRTHYQPLEIWQTINNISGRVLLKENVQIDSIDVSDNKWIGAMPYTIALSCYPSGYFSGVFGVLDPNDAWDFKEQENATLSINHTVSCRGINTSRGTSNALDNARIWAAGRTGVNSTVYPILISGVSPSNFFLVSQNESIDRLNGVYSVNEIYSNDLARTGYGIIRYSTEADSGNNLITINLQGTAEGGGKNITGLRYAFNRLDKAAIALKQYQSLFQRNDLNTTPISQNFNEDPFSTKIDFNYSFNNDNSPNVSFDYTVECSVGTNGNITATIQGIVRARGGSLVNKLSQTIAYANTVNLYNLVLPFYNTFDVSSLTPLNSHPISNGRSVNQSDGTVELNATFNNNDLISSLLDDFNFVIDFKPTVMQVDSKPKLDGRGAYSVVSLGYGERASISINGSAVCHAGVSLSDGINAVKQACYSLFGQYGIFNDATLDEERITSSDNKSINFTFSWSFIGSQTIGPESINSLNV